MTTLWGTQLPPWVGEATCSTVALLGSYLAGQFIKGVVCRRLATLAKKTTWQWDEVIIEGIRNGIPFWSILLGLYIAFGFWQLPDRLSHALTNILFVSVALSATFLLAGIAGKLIVLYGGKIQQALPVTSLTQHIIKRYDQEGITIPFPIRTIRMQRAERSQAPPASDSRSGQPTEVTRG